MERINLNRGTREEILAELEQFGLDRTRQGREDKAREYARAIAVIEDGGEEVRIGRHLMYQVTEVAE